MMQYTRAIRGRKCKQSKGWEAVMQALCTGAFGQQSGLLKMTAKSRGSGGKRGKFYFRRAAGSSVKVVHQYGDNSTCFEGTIEIPGLSQDDVLDRLTQAAEDYTNGTGPFAKPKHKPENATPKGYADGVKEIAGSASAPTSSLRFAESLGTAAKMMDSERELREEKRMWQKEVVDLEGKLVEANDRLATIESELEDDRFQAARDLVAALERLNEMED